MNQLRIVNLPVPGANTATPSPISPVSPISPISPICPNINKVNTPSDEPVFGLRQSSTDLVSEYNTDDVADSNDELQSFDTEKVTTNKNATLFPPLPTMNNSASNSSIIDTKEFLLNLSAVHDDCFLFQNGYKKLRKISDSLQGVIYEGIIIDATKRAKVGFERVAIKQISKALHLSGEAIQDDLRIIVEEDIVKEAMILKYLTKDNRPNGGYIAKFIDFFEDDEDYYLVTEYVGDCNLAEFVKTAHKYIKQRKLPLAEYKKVIKFLFWQICVMIHWMHNDMKCVHLDLCLENIAVRNGAFEINEKDGKVSINPQIAIKLIDFGLSELFSPSATSYKIGKWGLKDSFSTTAPNVYNELIYDGMKADIWSLGCILFQMSTGKILYRIPDESADAGYYCTIHDKLGLHLQLNRLERYFNTKTLELMKNMLNIDESSRFTASKVLQCPWFIAYFSRYQSRIERKSKSQREQIKKQSYKMRCFPYYSM